MHKYFKYCYITQVIYFDTLNTNKDRYIYIIYTYIAVECPINLSLTHLHLHENYYHTMGGM